MGHAYQVNVNTILSPALMQIKGETMVVLASVSISNGRVEEGSQYNPVKCIKKTNALSKCKLVKFREVSDSVWICLKAVITEKTLKEE